MGTVPNASNGCRGCRGIFTLPGWQTVCAGELKIIAAILERTVIEKILSHLGLDPQPPPKGRAREAGPHVAA